MKFILKTIPCDVVVIPSLTDSIMDMIEDYFVFIVLLTVVLLVVGALVTIRIVSKKSEEPKTKNDAENDVGEDKQ